MKQLLRSLFVVLATAVASHAAPTPADSAALLQAKLDSVNARFSYQTGKITLSEGLGHLTVPAGMRFLNAEQSRVVLTKLWGNPESAAEGVQGMLFPADKGPVSENNWAFVVSYEPMGYVKDDDAADIDYDELLADMQQETRDANADREAAGYPTTELLGWAVPPHYDKATHALHWAKKLQFAGHETATLNYDVRLLGRKGVLSLNAVAEPSQLALVQAQIPGVIKGADFAQGMRYADFNPDLDEVAAYSLGGLVAGKVLAKAGFFALILKFWKVILAVVAAGFTGLRRFFGGRSRDEEPQLALDNSSEQPTNPPAEV